MANLRRNNPFDDLDDMFKGLMLRPVRMEQQVPQIKMAFGVYGVTHAVSLVSQIRGGMLCIG